MWMLLVEFKEAPPILEGIVEEQFFISLDILCCHEEYFIVLDSKLSVVVESIDGREGLRFFDLLNSFLTNG